MTTIQRDPNRHRVLHTARPIMERANSPIMLPPSSLALSGAARRMEIAWSDSEIHPVEIRFRQGEVLLELSCG